jgi:hypothetical protein
VTKPSRAVTRHCRICRKKLSGRRLDTLYCSAACRQIAHRARTSVSVSAIDREIEAARLHFWALVLKKARANGHDVSQVVTGIAQFVDLDGNVYEGGFPGSGTGRFVGRRGDGPFRPG